MNNDFNFVELPEVTSAFCEVCDRIADVYPHRAESIARLKKEAESNPIFPVAPNLSSLLIMYNRCFDKSDLLYYVHILSTALHALSSDMLALMQG